MQDYSELIRAVETWQFQRVELFKRQPFNEGSNAKALREFVEINNRLSRQLISLLQKQDPDFWESMQELATNCMAIVKGGKTFVNGQDVSQEGM